MSKPNGIALRFGQDGMPSLRMVSISRADDAIWDAVEYAIREGMTAEAFKSEAANAWRHVLKQVADDAVKELNK